MASGLEIPVRHDYAIEMPAVDEGPVRIQATTLPLRLNLVDVKAFKGRLWISMAASFDAAGPPPAVAIRTLPVAAASPSAKEAPEQRVARLQHEVSQLRQRFLEAAERDPQVQKGSTAQGHLTAAVSPALFEDVVRRVADHYLDRVDVQLEGVKVEKSGEIHKDTFLGKIHAGDWNAFIWFPQIRGTLRAGVPRVRLPGGNRVLVEMPVHLERGSGTARVHFKWDSRAVVNIFCRDFEITQEVKGTVEHRDYPVTGRFTMAAGPDDLRALPSFDDRFRIHPVLSAASWAAIRAALEAQNTFERCGMGLHPDDVVAQLDARVKEGFVVKLPRKLFRPVRLPTRLTPTVSVQDHDVDVELTQSQLDAGPDGVWYGVWVKAGLPGPRGAGPAANDPCRSTTACGSASGRPGPAARPLRAPCAPWGTSRSPPPRRGARSAPSGPWPWLRRSPRRDRRRFSSGSTRSTTWCSSRASWYSSRSSFFFTASRYAG